MSCVALFAAMAAVLVTSVAVVPKGESLEAGSPVGITCAVMLTVGVIACIEPARRASGSIQSTP